MSYPDKIEDISNVKVKVTRAELRNRKIIIVIEPDLLSNEVFAVNPYYDEGENKNKLQYAKFNISVEENYGRVSANVSYLGAGSHFTTGHTQLHESFEKVFISKKEKAIHEILTIEEKWYNQPDRVSKILKMWDKDTKFKSHLISLCEKREIEFKEDKIKKANKMYKEAIDLMNEALGN
jgi:hypothetical protein